MKPYPQAILRELDRLTGKTERLQNIVAARRRVDDDPGTDARNRRVYEYLREAKDRLMRAIREAEQ